FPTRRASDLRDQAASRARPRRRRARDRGRDHTRPRAHVRVGRHPFRRDHSAAVAGQAARERSPGGRGVNRALDDLRARLASGDPEERRRATSSLTELDDELAAGLVIQALADEDWRVRKEAVLVALALAPSPGMLDRLVGALSVPDNVGLRNAAVEALAGYGDDAVDALAVVLPRLDADGRKLAVEALGHSGRASALAVLTPLLEDEDPNVRLSAVEAIAAIGAAGVGEVSALLESCLFAREPLTALAALEGLNAIGAVLPWSTIERCLEDPARRRPALLAAGRSRDARAVPVLLDALGSARGSALVEVTFALRELVRDPESLAALTASRGRVSLDVGQKLVAMVSEER